MRKLPFTPRGFTLVELLIVIGVIVVLIALLLPSVASVRARARSAECQSNLVGIIRASDTCIESMLSQTYSTNPSFFYADHDHQRSRRPNPTQLGLMSESEWSKRSRIEKTAWYWSYINNHLMDLEEKYSARVRLVSFEQLLADQDELLNDIQAFLEIPIRKLKREVATNSSEELNQRRVSLKEYSAEEIESIKRITEATQARVTADFSDKP